VLLSGDVHMAQLGAVRCGDTVIHELTSSGLTHSVGDFGPAAAAVAGLLLWIFPQTHLLAATHFGRNFGELDIVVGADGQPAVTGRIHSLHPGPTRGQVVIERRFDGLSPPGGPGAVECVPIHGVEAPRATALRAAAVVAAAAACAAACCLCLLGARRRARKAHDE